MHSMTAAIFMGIPLVCMGADLFRIDSELRTNFVDGTSTQIFLTGYQYDENGTRIQSTVWSGKDTALAAMSRVKFTYAVSGELVDEIFLSVTDTLSIVRHIYGGGKLIAVKTLTKTGVVRFTDSMVYNGKGEKQEELRISSEGLKIFFHRFGYNGQGEKASDSLYELIASAYVATQATIFNYNADTTVASEVSWRLSGSDWYCISTSFMGYSAGSLVSVSIHERNGIGTAMTDSVAFENDGHGHRILEAAYDGEQALTRKIVYTWREIQPPVVSLGKTAYPERRSMLTSVRNRLMVTLLPNDRGEISVYSMTGNPVCRVAVIQSGEVPLSGRIGKGSYVAIFTQSGNQQALHFSN